jgi:hypothetical protein
MPRTEPEVDMSSPKHHLPRPALRRRIEQVLAAEPAGITTHELRAALSLRARALGETPPGPHQLVRQLGHLLVEGRIDERDGTWVLLVAAEGAVAPRSHDRAA